MDRFDAIPVLLHLAARARLEGRRDDEDALRLAIDVLWMDHSEEHDRLCRAALLERHLRRVAGEILAAEQAEPQRETPGILN